MLLPDPPCCKIPGARSGCNDSSVCTKVAELGFDSLDRNRKPIFLTLGCLSVIVTILAIIPMASLSLSTQDVKNTYWTRGEFGDTTFYIGLNKIVVESGGSTEWLRWDDAECDQLFSEGNDACSECKAACADIVRIVILNFFVIAMTITSNLKRSTREGDLNCTKCMAIFSGTVSSIVMLFSLATFSEGCYYNLPGSTAEGQDITYSQGPSFVCLVIPQIFKLTEVIFHILTPVPHKKEESLNLGILNETGINMLR
jgi:hypothetical protein